MRLPRSQRAPRIDGRFDKGEWACRGASGPFVHPGTGRADPNSGVHAEAWGAWDDRALYLAFRVYDSKPISPFRRDDEDPHLWEKSSAIELMLQPGERVDNRDYYELQVDVHAAVWDTFFEDYNHPIVQRPGEGPRFGHQRWQSGLERAVSIQRGRDYVIEIALPWSALDRHAAARRPKAGERWRANFYSFREGQRDALAWSPLLGQGNFHRSARFGMLRFVGPCAP